MPNVERKADKPWTKLTPEDKASIRKELNEYKVKLFSIICVIFRFMPKRVEKSPLDTTSKFDRYTFNFLTILGILITKLLAMKSSFVYGIFIPWSKI